MIKEVVMSEEVSALERLDVIAETALAALESVADDAALQGWKTAHLGRSSALMQTFSQLSQVSKELRPAVGQKANEVKGSLETALAEKTGALKEAALARSLSEDRLDVSLPGRRPQPGRLHPSTQVLREITQVFGELGFQVFSAPDVETDENNFELLNIPAYHPARDMWDTFYTTKPGVLLRTHTSPGQVRVMRERAPEEIRVILPGMCYRFEQTSARSEIQFHQVEGIMVGKHITFGDLKGVLNAFARRMYGANVRSRLRPSYFPFTEPSAEMDIECFMCGGKGCGICKNSGWLEILGCGMMHPTVLRNGGYDPEIYSGFAFGMGPERITMLRHKIEDIRYFWSDDIRFLEQL